MCLHIGMGLDAINMGPDFSLDNFMVLSTQVTVLAVQDLLWGPAMRKYPDLKIAFSEGGIGWIPFLMDRVDRHYENQKWTGQDFGDKTPSEVFREHALACFIYDPTALKLYDDIGIDIIAFETDYPHSDSLWPDAPEVLLEQCNGAGLSDDDDRQDQLEERRAVLRLRPVRSTSRRSRPRSGRFARRRPTSTPRSCPGANGGHATRRTPVRDLRPRHELSPSTSRASAR